MHVCEICGASETKTVVVVDGFKVGKCAGCRLVYVTNPVDEEELTKLYTDQYFLELENNEYSSHSPDANLRRLWWFNEQRLDAIERLKKPGLLLDVGCGPGYFMLSARKRGWRVKGLDISPKAVEFSKSSLGLDVIEGQLGKVALPKSGFDLITAWQALEHSPHPLTALIKMRRLLKPEGALALEVPNLDSLPGRLKGNRFSGSAQPKFHRYYFTHGSLHRLLKRAGFSSTTSLNCRYRDGTGFFSGAKSLAKQLLRSVGADSFVTILTDS